MRSRLLLVLIGCFFFTVSLRAQEAQPAELSFNGLAISSFDSTEHQPLLARFSPFPGASNRLLGPMTMTQVTLLSYPEAFGLFGATPLDYLPTFVSAYPTLGPTTKAPTSYRNLPDYVSSFNHASGEVGFFYGKGTGKSDLEATSGYVIGEIDNGNTQISVGASYNKVSARQPH